MQRFCVFCEIVAGREPADILYETDDVMVFRNRLRWVPVMLLAHLARAGHKVVVLVGGGTGLMTRHALAGRPVEPALALPAGGQDEVAKLKEQIEELRKRLKVAQGEADASREEAVRQKAAGMISSLLLYTTVRWSIMAKT